MLPKQERLTYKDITSLPRPTGVCHSTHFKLSVYKHTDLFQVSIVVSKKVSKVAVRRNTIRRCLYDVFAKHKEYLEGGMYVLRVKVGAEKVTKRQLCGELEELIGRVVKTR